MEFQTTDFRKGLKVEVDDKPYLIVKCDFTNPGKGSAFYKVKLKNLENGNVLERTYKSGVSTGVMKPDLDEKEVEYMYGDTDGFNFMDQSTYETIHVTTEQCGDAVNYLQEGIKLYVLYYKGNPISIELPNFVELKVTQTDPGLKGDTAQGGLKKAIMETGLQVNVPLFINEGELLKIDTRTGEYVERVKS
ncbi:elongation factor P [Halobacteriovorax sp. GB3]|uniref:elongation factor P n=1 Tax=Halobacteriovorax sp. GB3 TaxID=2719615 RepID=UPI00235F5B83|nr:elongation factor P [Halobacteriovorax sp. GB3]MDD0854595.1 elongation factor P [Halobacteriovorax sp. GB3]